VPRTRLRYLFPAIAVATAVAISQGQSACEPNLEIRTSRIPHTGNGVHTKVPIPKGAHLGGCTGEFITEEQYWRRAKEDRWQDMMGLLARAKPRTGGIAAGEELRVDYGPRYRYDFMEDPEVIKFFGHLRASGPRRQPQPAARS